VALTRQPRPGGPSDAPAYQAIKATPARRLRRRADVCKEKLASIDLKPA
jgi:hypothetical protein